MAAAIFWPVVSILGLLFGHYSVAHPVVSLVETSLIAFLCMGMFGRAILKLERNKKN